MDFKKIIFSLSLTGAMAFAAPNFSIMGFATLDGGTTGGKGGSVVTPTTLAELRQYAEDETTPYIILITKEFNTGVSVKISDSGYISSSGSITTTYGAVIRLGSNKSLIGVGSSALFNRIGILIQCQSNIIIRNIAFTMKYVPITDDGENKIVGWVNGADTTLTDPDCIGIQADDTSKAEADRYSKNIWIDHCEFYNEDPDNIDKDRYDGLIDSKNYSTNITISWCYFHDHPKALLAGKSGSDKYTRQLTYSHNYFKNIASRAPLIRWADCHYLNNYLTSSQNGVDDDSCSNLYAEGNYFDSLSKPVFGDSSGYATFVGNSWINCTRVPSAVFSEASGAKNTLDSGEEVLSGCSFTPSTYYSYSADAVADVKSLVTTYAGVGKIDVDEYTGISAKTVKSSTLHPSYRLQGKKLTLNTTVGTQVFITNLLGTTIYNAKTTGTTQEITLPESNGTYLIKIGNTSSCRIPNSAQF